MNNQYIIGIDPGITGAASVLNEDLSIKEFYMFEKDAKDKKIIDCTALYNMLSKYEMNANVFIEKVWAMPSQGRNQGAQGMFNFGQNYGIIKTVCSLLFDDIKEVSPITWKSKAGLRGTDKKHVLTVAAGLYHEINWSKQKMIPVAEATIIARVFAK